MTVGREPVRALTKTELVYMELYEMITTGAFSAGSRLRLSQLAERFGTSEIPVREALYMLQGDGLVVIDRHRGARVADVRWEVLYEALVMRTHLEVLALEEAVPFHSLHTLEPIERLLAEMDLMVAEGRASDYREANRRFHMELYAPGPYPSLVEEIRVLWDRLWQTRTRSLFHLRPDEMGRAQAEHREMVAAVRRGDREGASAAARDHRRHNLHAWADVIATAENGEEETD